MHFSLDPGGTIFAPINNTFTSLTTATFAISTVGMFLSVLALVLLIITACIFKEWRDSYKNQLLIQFMFARCLYTFVRYFYDIRTLIFVSSCKEKHCIIYMDEVMMIYTEIVLLAWMYVFTRQMYHSLVLILNAKTPNIWKVSIATWVSPVAVTMIMYVLYMTLQDGKDFMVYFLYLTIIKWPVLIANATLLILILKSLTKTKKIDNGKRVNNTRLVVVMNFMIWSFCLQQALMDAYKLIYVNFNISSFLLLMFNIGTMYHCAVSVMFWVFGNAKTRKMWRNKLCCVGKIPLSSQSSLSSINSINKEISTA